MDSVQSLHKFSNMPLCSVIPVLLRFMHIHRTYAYQEFCGFLAITWLTDVLSGCARGNSTVHATAASSERQRG